MKDGCQWGKKMKSIERVFTALTIIIVLCCAGLFPAWAAEKDIGGQGEEKAELKKGDQEQVVLDDDSKREPVDGASDFLADEDLKEMEEAMREFQARRASSRLMPFNYQTYAYQPDSPKPLSIERRLSQISKEAAGKVYYEMKEEGDSSLDARVAVVAAVPLSDFKRDTEFGRIVAEYLLTDLADRGLRVTELRLGKEIHILPQTGEFIMSRNIGELAEINPELDHVVVSTFTNTRKTLILQGRLVSLKDGRVKTSWRHTLPLNRELMGFFQTEYKPYTIAVKGIM